MVRPQRLQRQTAFYSLLVVVCLTIGLLVASPWVSAKNKAAAKAARLAKGGQVASNSQYNYRQSSNYVIQASLEGVC